MPELSEINFKEKILDKFPKRKKNEKKKFIEIIERGLPTVYKILESYFISKSNPSELLDEESKIEFIKEITKKIKNDN